MFLRILQYIKGYIRIRVTGYSAERFLNACRHKKIYIWELQNISGSYEMNITIKGFRQLKPIIRKTGTKVVVVKKSGLPFLLHKYRRRRLFFGGAFFCIILIYTMSRFIWGIDIAGNITHTDEELLKFLDSKEIQNGMVKSRVDCTRIVKDIRKEYNDIVWVSASIHGTKLYVQIKENEDSMDILNGDGEKEVDSEKERSDVTPMDIVADRNCKITDMVVRKGVAQVKVGDEVKKGTVLVSGQVPVNNDAKEVTGYRYQESDADITAEVALNYEDSNNHTYEVKKKFYGPKGEKIEKKESYLVLGSYRFHLGKTKNHYEHFEVYEAQKQVHLSDNFYLPVIYGSRTIVPYTPIMKRYTEKEEQQILTERFYRNLDGLEKKGVEILENNVKIYTGSDSSKAQGTLVVRMPVGEKKPSELLDIPENKEETQQGEKSDGNDGSGN